MILKIAHKYGRKHKYFVEECNKFKELTSLNHDYENILYFDNPFSDDEIINGGFQIDFDKFSNEEKIIQNAFRLEKKITKLKKLTVNGLGMFLKTLNQIDSESRQIAFKNFDVANVKAGLSKLPKITSKLEQLCLMQDNRTKHKRFQDDLSALTPNSE